MTTQLETATQVWNYLTGKGWTQESVAALLGNMQSESGIVADRWESDNVGNLSGGYGLVQWTPATKYIDWAKANGLTYQEVSSQCKRLEWEVANGQQFFHPSMSFKQFIQSTQSPETLADIFIRYYERPYNPNQPARQTQARYWYNALKGSKATSSTNTNNKGVTTMYAIYWIPNKAKTGEDAYYFNGVSYEYISHPDAVKILKDVYKDNNGKSIPEYHWKDSAPWYARLQQPVVNLQDLANKVDKIGKKVGI